VDDAERRREANGEGNATPARDGLKVRKQCAEMGWHHLQRRLLRELGRDNTVAPAPLPPYVLRWASGASHPATVSIEDAPDRTARLIATPPALPSATMMHPLTLDWETGDGSTGTLWMSRDGGPETLLARGPGGKFHFPSVAATSGYVFKLYTGAADTELRRSLVLLPAPVASGTGGRRTQARQTAYLARRLAGQRLHLWWYHRFMRALLGRSRHLIWRLPAAISASVRFLCDGPARSLARGLSDALGERSWQARLRIHWSLCYQDEADKLILLQIDKVSPEWAMTHAPIRGTVPPEGAILLSVHHVLRWLSYYPLSVTADSVTNITMEPSPDRPIAFAEADPITQRALLAIHRLRAGGITWRDCHWQRGSREIRRLLRDGGHITFMVDVFIDGWPRAPVFGTPMPVPRGPVWFAEQTGKPIIPFMLVPTRGGWALEFGAPIEPTQEEVARAIEWCVRRAPGMWRRDHATAWLRARSAPQSTR
jgi:hypothetical protein